MYGFSVSKNGILTDNYYKILGKYELPEPQGIYIMIRISGDEIILNQDFLGSYGIYIYENKNKNYFAISNSFLLLEEHLVGKYDISFNKDFASSLISTDLCPYSIQETLINEIKQIPSNACISINKKKKEFNINYIDYKENSIALESEEGLKIIDNWIDKWGYIIRSLKKQTDNISFDLSGGFDSRLVLTILLNSGIDLNTVLIHSEEDKGNDHDVDLKIARNISSKFGLKLNNLKLDNNGIIWNTKNILFKALYTKLGFHKEFSLNNKYYNKPQFIFKGSGGEFLRGYPGFPFSEYIKLICFRKIKGHENEFYRSSIRLIKRSESLIKKKKKFTNDFEISSIFNKYLLGRNHFGKGSVERFMTNIYTLQPLIDPDIHKINFGVNRKSSHDLIAYIFYRLSKDLIEFPFQGNRKLDSESIKKAKLLNQNYIPYKIKLNYKFNYYIDDKRKSPVPSSKYDNTFEYLKKMFNSFTYIKEITKIYDKNVYNWANDYSKISNYHPFRHHYALLAIVIIIENLNIKNKSISNMKNKIIFNLK